LATEKKKKKGSRWTNGLILQRARSKVAKAKARSLNNLDNALGLGPEA